MLKYKQEQICQITCLHIHIQVIALDRILYTPKSIDILLISPQKTYVVGT